MKFIRKLKRKIRLAYKKLPHIKMSIEFAAAVYRLEKHGIDHGMSIHELAYCFCRYNHATYLYPFLSYRTIYDELNRFYEIEQYI